jgi:hypothetical protein
MISNFMNQHRDLEEVGNDGKAVDMQKALE